VCLSGVAQNIISALKRLVILHGLFLPRTLPPTFLTADNFVETFSLDIPGKFALNKPLDIFLDFPGQIPLDASPRTDMYTGYFPRCS